MTYHIQDELGVNLLAAGILNQIHDDYMYYRPIAEFCKPRGNSAIGWRRYSTAVKEVASIYRYLNGETAALMLTMEPEVFIALLEKKFYDKHCNYYTDLMKTLPRGNAISKERDAALGKTAAEFREFYKRWFRLARPLPESDEFVLEIMRRCKTELMLSR